MTKEKNNEYASLFHKMKNTLHTELAKLKKMTGKDKAWYIWEYYKYPIVILLFVMGFMISIVGSWLDPSTTYLHYTVFNLSLSSQSEPVPLTAEFHSAMELGEYDIISYDALSLSSTGEYDEYTVAMTQRFYAQAAAAEVDVLLMPASDHQTMASLDLYADLEAILPSDLWELVKADAIYVTNPETGESYAGGIDVSDTPILLRCEFIASSSVILSIVTNSQRMEHATELIEYIYGYNGR